MLLDSTLVSTLNTKAPFDGVASGLGNCLQGQVGVVVGTYDFARDGGAIGSISLKDSITGMPISLPAGAIVTKSYIDVETPCTTSASGTLALSTGQTAADILGATAAASVTGILAGVSVGTAATMKKISSSAKTPVAVIATGALTAGKLRVFMEFVVSSA